MVTGDCAYHDFSPAATTTAGESGLILLDYYLCAGRSKCLDTCAEPSRCKTEGPVVLAVAHPSGPGEWLHLSEAITTVFCAKTGYDTCTRSDGSKREILSPRSDHCKKSAGTSGPRHSFVSTFACSTGQMDRLTPDVEIVRRCRVVVRLLRVVKQVAIDVVLHDEARGVEPIPASASFIRQEPFS